jgi:hypothetical protein
MKKNAQRKNSAKRQGSTRRRTRNHNQRSPQTTQAAATSSPNLKSPRESQLDFGEATSGVPSATQSGGPQGTAGAKALTSESIAELFEEGQLDSEVAQDVETAPDADRGELETREASREEDPEYRNRNRL